ncbi:MAG: hypothetical protein HWD61_14190 [Parachlamydiaceae bacterium]|nr:MAG: hypothetical protein HWD61_14190 [Parachlamydiaceae bacterium]
MLKKAILGAYALASLVSFACYADEEKSEDNILSCRDCNLLACSCGDQDPEQKNSESEEE